ncbi:MAG: hypothetical protein RLZZ182_634 [Pseudomonadota bacterium]|jgi:hypothetical protein
MPISITDTPLHQTGLRDRYLDGQPFPLLVLDDFLPLDVANGVLSEIKANQDFQKSNDYIFAKNKFESPRIENLGPFGAQIRDFLLSPDFASAISDMFGHTLFVDPEFIGGGLHRGGEGSFLDMHADFNLHPAHRRWIRELNLLLYLNKDWQPEYGGCLELLDPRTGQSASVEPRFNRMVLMLTKDYTLHGYKPLHFPKGTFRTSIAAYAYSEARSDEEVASLKTTTTWVPDDGGAVKAMVAKVTPQLVTLKQRLLGSATARKK